MDRIPDGTVQSVVKQSCTAYEIIILQNNVSAVPEEKEIREQGLPEKYAEIPIRKLQIRKKGKGNALNIGIQQARYDFICVLDADCVLEENAVDEAMRHFDDQNVSAVGGRLEAISEKKNILTFCQRVEYRKTFNIWRPLFNRLNANCLISGAFGIFRKSDLVLVDGYDTDTVGEDMELVLSMQECLRGLGKRVLYEKKSICYTGTPYTMHRLLHQRDRWQRGLLDCLIKHKRLIFNPRYGLLGCTAMPYQIWFELLGPIFILLHVANLICAVTGFEMWFAMAEFLKGLLPVDIDIPQSWSLYFVYLGFETYLTCQAEYIECRKWYVFIIKIPEAVAATVLGTLLSVPLAFARIWGMISFHWRKLVW